ncbi:SMI1/KNR4 family protein [Streptomyces sp. NPDC056479]|uniref:SMI1/KNR4 family protein n=1 Tax=Streptomyces sp. NPDC056479 TaxID=3345832 RepID=UPI003687E741
MSWVEQILNAVGRRPEHVQVEWAEIEAELGVPLPADFKELCEAFGRGEFNGFLYLYSSKGGNHLEVIDALKRLHRAIGRFPDSESVYEPYQIFQPGRGGLIRWAGAAAEGYEYFWLADDASAPESWPIIARTDFSEEWHRYEMSAAEFIHRALTDGDFKPFSMVRYSRQPHYESYADDEE